MLKTIGIIAAVLVVAVAAILIFAATRPDSFRVERSVNIKAPPEKIFALVNNLRAHAAWSPWEKKDPAMKRLYFGPESGKGAAYEWDGDKNIGAGRMEVTESSSPSKVIFKLDFIRPFEAHNTAEFALVPSGEATRVTWAIYGPSPYISKVMGVFFSMDSMIGKEFEAGLADLKAIAEK
ncbi:MAG TPA: SRPBCC family protein [Vineibacter sp.]|nr:SRPBCC family protein [Vineibacter sp.]